MDEKYRSNIFEYTAEALPKTDWRSWLIGRPLSNEDAPHQTIGKIVGLAVFSSDALSSVAYGPQEMMTILALAGVTAIPNALPLFVAIVGLLAILTFSYEQTIHAYPGGGGAYIVARDNLGELPAQMAGSALLMDYILTVAVSISSGVAQIVSAFPNLEIFRVEIAVAMILFIMVINLRGVKESGVTFAIPTYFFLIMAYATVAFGLFRYITGTLPLVIDPPHLTATILQPLSLFLILRAFANGTTSLTGVEAISNGITAFKAPSSKNAGQTLLWMSGILGSLLLGVTFLAIQTHAMPSEEETVISQIARTVFDGRGILYLASIVSTTVILVMAANTAFADFPRLGALTAGDGFLPRQMTFRGSRLVFSRGIVTLSLFASALVIIFHASVTNLIPLYAIGVFLSFTLSQFGMARRWYKCGHLKPGEEIVEPGSTLRYEKNWQFKMVVNAVGSVATFVVMIIFAIFKFADGAWVVVVLIPILVSIFFSIHRHYKGLAHQLSLEGKADPGLMRHNRVFMPIGGVHRGSVKGLHYARSLSDDVTVVHVSIEAKDAEKIKAKWETWGEGTRLVLIHSPYRVFLEPLLDYINKMDAQRKPGEMITIVVPQFISKTWITQFLHTRTADTLRKALLNRENIVITEVPYQVK